MRKRLIVVPKDSIAEDDLNYDRQSEDQIIEYSLSEDEAEILYKMGVFECINKIAGTLIDDFEEDWITDTDTICQVLNELILVKKQHQEPLIKKALSTLISAFNESSIRKTGIYFYF